MLYSLIRPLLFQLDAEQAHELTLKWGQTLCKTPLKCLLANHVTNKHPVEVMGLTFPNKIGLAAGLDKNGEFIDLMASMGFGFIEIGTITPRPQPGNPKPRMFRLPKAQALINRLGFNNKGVDYLLRQVDQSQYSGILGINIGKNIDTPIENALKDYLHCLNAVYSRASYITVNISSPNTPGLRDLQKQDALKALLEPLKNQQAQLQSQYNAYKPIVVKFAPDVDDADVETMATVVKELSIDGVIATNTTASRTGVEGLAHADEQGGLSGPPVKSMSDHVVQQLARELGDIPIIGLGGIDSVQAGRDKLNAGASLVQIYTALIYQGPTLVKQLAEAL